MAGERNTEVVELRHFENGRGFEDCTAVAEADSSAEELVVDNSAGELVADKFVDELGVDIVAGLVGEGCRKGWMRVSPQDWRSMI